MSAVANDYVPSLAEYLSQRPSDIVPAITGSLVAGQFIKSGGYLSIEEF